MRKIFLLLVTSLVLFACEKEAPEQVTDENGSTPDIFEPTIVPMGALPGKFTVNAEGKQVYFSKGNLWYGKVEGIEEKTFNFEANQWGFSSKWNENHVSHFYWNKVAVIAYSKKFDMGYRTGSDIFFTNGAETSAKSDFTVNGVTGKYRTLSKDECDYLFNKRTVNGGTKEGKSYQIATINSDVSGGVYGVILYPDGYTAQTSGTSYTSADWAAMEAAGCVFLPAAGQRTESVLSSVNRNICYWLSYASSDQFAYAAFSNNETNVSVIMNFRYLGYSVRLVTDCQ